MTRLFVLISLVFSAVWALAVPIPTVDCDQGQSLNQTLAKMNKFVAATVTVKGTCTEYVVVDNFDGLTISGLAGATLQQPNTPPPNGLPVVLLINGSRRVTVTGFRIHSLPSAATSIQVKHGSTGVLLRSLNIDGSWGIENIEASQVWISKVTINLTSGYAAIAAWDKSDVHITDTLIQRPQDSQWHAGLTIGSGHVTMQGVTIRDMQQSITIGGSGTLDLVNFDPTAGTDVLIDNPGGNNFNGVIVSDASSLNIGSVTLRINNAGQSYGDETGAVLVTNGSTMNASSFNGGNIIVSGSQGQGIVVSNNSHVQLAASSIAGGLHGGLVVVNLSTASVDYIGSATFISGNASDLFCDTKSLIYGISNIANASTVQCNNLFAWSHENMP
jgi:hypothetical protein